MFSVFSMFYTLHVPQTYSIIFNMIIIMNHNHNHNGICFLNGTSPPLPLTWDLLGNFNRCCKIDVNFCLKDSNDNLDVPPFWEWGKILFVYREFIMDCPEGVLTKEKVKSCDVEPYLVEMISSL